MAKENTTIQGYDLVTSPKGYFNKREVTNQDPHALIVGSKNMIINDADKVASRPGFVLDGQERTVNHGIDSNYDFLSKQGKKILRAYFDTDAGDDNGKLQVRVTNIDNTIQWYDLLTGLTYTDFCFTTWWADSDSTRLLIFVDGTSNVRSWGGGIAFLASSTPNSITILGDETWFELGFLTAYSTTVTIPGYGTYEYDVSTLNSKTLTFTDILPINIPINTPLFQGVTNNSISDDGKVVITPNIVMTKENQVWYGDTRTSIVYGSANNDFTYLPFSTPRQPGEGFKIVLDNFTVGFTQDESDVYVFAGLDDLYKVNFQLFNDNGSYIEAINVKKLRAGSSQATISQKAIIPVKNGIMYITNEKTLTWLTSIENVFTPQTLPISDAIKNDWDALDLRDATGIFFENAVWIAIPRENLTYLYDFDKKLWQTPFTIPISGFSIIKNETTQRNELYGHSNSVNETYKLNSGLSDNGVRIDFAAAFAYRQFGNRSKLNQFDEYYNELYMSTSTIVTVEHRYEYRGSEIIIPKTIDGSDAGLKFAPSGDANLGKNNLGKNPLGSTVVETSTLNKYRCIHEMKLIDFFEHQVVYSSDSENAQFEILSHGPNVRPSTNIPRSIKR